MDIGKQPVQGVAEFVEEGVYLVQAQQGLGTIGGLGNAQHVDDDRLALQQA